LVAPTAYIATMNASLVLNLSALLSLLPAPALLLRRREDRDPLFWLLLAVAVVGPLVVAVAHLWQGWLTGLSAALWVSIAASMVLFAVISLLTPHGWRLTPLLLPYLFLFGVAATLSDRLPSRPLATPAPAGWLDVHILISVTTFGLVTIAAIAGLAVFLQERALKQRRPSALTPLLPSVADAEALQIQLLVASAVILGLGILTGVATEYLATGQLFVLTHKTLFALLAFLVILVLLAMHLRTGLRGRRAARLLLVAYLLLFLAYPGVKFVTDVLIG
jgi:ABC-type uncharacterized transport system permease subunit